MREEIIIMEDSLETNCGWYCVSFLKVLMISFMVYVRTIQKHCHIEGQRVPPGFFDVLLQKCKYIIVKKRGTILQQHF